MNPHMPGPAPEVPVCPRCQQPAADHRRHCPGAECRWIICGELIIDPARRLEMGRLPITPLRGES